MSTSRNECPRYELLTELLIVFSKDFASRHGADITRAFESNSKHTSLVIATHKSVKLC